MTTVAEFGAAPRGLHHQVGGLRQVFDAGAGAVLQHELEASGGAQPEDRRKAEGENRGFGHAGELRLHARQDGAQIPVRRMCVPPRESAG